MHGLGLSVDASQIPHAAAAVFLGVAVQKFAPVSPGGHAYAISLARYRSEVTHDYNFFRRRPAFTQQRNNTGSGVIAVDPFKSGRIAVELVQGRLLAINPVQLFAPSSAHLCEPDTATHAIPGWCREPTRAPGRIRNP